MIYDFKMVDDTNLYGIARQLRTLLTDLIAARTLEEERKIARQIAEFCATVSDRDAVQRGELQRIHEACLPMEHWKDDTGYCTLTRRDVRNFITSLSRMLRQRPPMDVVSSRK